MLPRRVVRIGFHSLLSVGLVLLVAAQLAPSVFFFARLAASRTVAPTAATTQRTTPQSDYGRLPISFEPNVGQAGTSARFLAHGAGYTLALSDTGATLALTPNRPAAPGNGKFRDRLAPLALPAAVPASAPPATVSMAWLGANPYPVLTGEDPLPGTVNYFIGNNPAKWHTNIPTYQQVRLHDIYPGVDLVYYGTGGQLEYDFVVAPGADPSRIALGFSGADRLGVDLAGDLRLSLPGGVVQQDHPAIYQTINGTRHAIAGGYSLGGQGRVGFTLGRYNPHLPLIIDPAYRFSTYLGGSDQDLGNNIAVDSAGNAYLTGSTGSTNFPTAHAEQSASGGFDDAFVTKLNAAGTAIIYSTYLGGGDNDEAIDIAVDSSGNAYITGSTSSENFPTVNAFQSTKGGDVYDGDAFVSKLSASGSSLVYSTYLGGVTIDSGISIAVDSSGHAYVTGGTTSTNFPTANAYQNVFPATYSSAFVTELSTDGASLVYSTYLGGSANQQGDGIAVDGSGDAYVTGGTTSTDFPTANAYQGTCGGATCVFVTKFNAAGTALVYSTYLGGSGGDSGSGIAVDASGSAYVTGDAGSTNFPTVNAEQGTAAGGGDAFLSKFTASGTSLVYSTYLGGSGYDQGFAVAVDSTGEAYVSGTTQSTDFPLANALQTTGPSGSLVTTTFMSRFSGNGAYLLYSSYLGTGGTFVNGAHIAVSVHGVAYMIGSTDSTTFPVVNAYQPTYGGSTDAFVTKMYTLPSVATTTGVFRSSNGVLYLKNANTTGPADITLYYGQPGDQPITGDWTGKGYKSIGVYRNGTFYLRNSNTTGYADIVVPFGNSTDIPVAGDWTGKGYDSIGVYRPSTSTFLLRDSNTAGAPDHVVRLGISGDVPIVGDWTAKGWDSVGVFRPSNGIVYLRNSNTTGVADINFVYGIAGDKPVVGDWDGNGTDTIGVDRGGHFLLRNSNTTGPANFSFYLGVSGDDPIAGPWLAPQVLVPSHP